MVVIGLTDKNPRMPIRLAFLAFGLLTNGESQLHLFTSIYRYIPYI